MVSLTGALWQALFGMVSLTGFSGRRSSTRTLWQPHSHNAPRELVLKVPFVWKVALGRKELFHEVFSASSFGRALQHELLRTSSSDEPLGRALWHELFCAGSSA